MGQRLTKIEQVAIVLVLIYFGSLIMAKFELRLRAREMRKKGISVKEIANTLGISKSTASIWVRDVVLSISQLEKLRQKSLDGAERGRLKSALMQKNRWIKKLEAHKQAGIKTIGDLDKREFFIAGLALYWAEGSKKSRSVEFCNSDPKMIVFLIRWLTECFSIGKEELRCNVGINEIHRKREKIINEYWSNITGIPLSQFRKIMYKKVINKKIYENYDNYFGTLAVRVMQPSRFYAKILGLIEGLAFASVAQG